MTDQNLAHDEHEAHAHPPYLKVFGILALLTLVELLVPPTIGSTQWLAVSVLVIIAVWKMMLIMGHFMHLKFDARILLLVAAVPAMLASLLVIAFLMEYA